VAPPTLTARPYMLQQVNNLLVLNVLYQQNTRLFPFLNLWIYLWLAETSQQRSAKQPG
jgi:hypothetical protein